MKIIAHRGVFDNKNIIENSVEAFNKAIELNIPIELDVQLTKDNVLVIYHDFNLKRLTGVDSLLQDMNYEDIRKLKLLNTSNIPTLEEVLKLNNNKVFLDIEIKSTKRIKDTCDILINLLDNYTNYDLKSFNPKIVRYIKKKYNKINVGYLIDNTYKNKFYNIFLKSKLCIFYSKADFIAINKKLLNKKLFRKLSKKMPTMIWTVTNKKEICDDSLTYICNNLPY